MASRFLNRLPVAFFSAAAAPAAVRQSSPAPAKPRQGARSLPPAVYDVAIIGGGIVGLAAAREIVGRYPGKKVVLLEKEAEVAHHQSGHNSGVIHAGIHLIPGTLVAKCVVRGNRMMYKYCEAHGLPCERVGKLICAPTADDAHHLDTLLARGRTNGVEGLEIITGAQVTELEPNVVVHSALVSPNTGIADYGAVARRIAEDLKNAPGGGAEIQLQFEVCGMDIVDDGSGGKAVEIQGLEPGQPGPVRRVVATNVLTCAGLHADEVASLGGGAPNPKVVTFRGSYYQMKPEYRNICKRNVYPTPSGGGIPVGVHFTPTCNERRGHQMLVGPGASVCFDREAYTHTFSLSYLLSMATNLGLWKFATNNAATAVTEIYRDVDKSAFMDQARKLIPTVTDDMVEESFSGVMGQVLLEDGTPTNDFIFERGAMQGTTLHMRSTRTCTAAFAVAEELVSIAADDFGWGEGERRPEPDVPFWPGCGVLSGDAAAAGGAPASAGSRWWG